jgi:hypothetical protein
MELNAASTLHAETICGFVSTKMGFRLCYAVMTDRKLVTENAYVCLYFLEHSTHREIFKVYKKLWEELIAYFP